jgi:Tol biopolymer transport system component
VISAGIAQDTAFVTVAPVGRFIAAAVEGPNAGSVVAMDFDGGNVRVVARNAILPRVSIDGRVIVHVGTDVSTYRMHLVEADGSLRRITPTTTPLVGEAYGQLAADGWIYFSGRFPDGNFAIWRVRPDGTGMERLTNGYAEWRSWPSPDGKKLVYSSYVDGWDVTIMDIATRQTISVKKDGLDAAWSPNGQFIAFPTDVGPYLWVADADGRNARSVPNTQFGFGGPIDWTADSQYLLTRTLCCVELVRVVDGERLPLTFSRSLVMAVRAP